ncbi:hypothetical protein BH10BAC5_BH10BAC5_01710 [soil metagenome]
MMYKRGSILLFIQYLIGTNIILDWSMNIEWKYK